MILAAILLVVLFAMAVSSGAIVITITATTSFALLWAIVAANVTQAEPVYARTTRGR